MKKIITLCLFALVMILSTNTIAAQDHTEINATSAKQTKELGQQIKEITPKQLEQVYEAFKTYNKRKALLDKSTTTSPKSISKNVAELNKTMGNILTAKQFDIYQSTFKKL